MTATTQTIPQETAYGKPPARRFTYPEQMAILRESRKRLLTNRLLLSRAKKNGGKWWRDILPLLKNTLVTPGVRDNTLIDRARRQLNWTMGDWTLDRWWRRVPQGCLWQYALIANERCAHHPNPEYYVKSLATAAMLWRAYPDPDVWERVIDRLKRLFRWSRALLLKLLRDLQNQVREFVPPGLPHMPYSPTGLRSGIGGSRQRGYPGHY